MCPGRNRPQHRVTIVAGRNEKGGGGGWEGARYGRSTSSFAGRKKESWTFVRIVLIMASLVEQIHINKKSISGRKNSEIHVQFSGKNRYKYKIITERRCEIEVSFEQTSSINCMR